MAEGTEPLSHWSAGSTGSIVVKILAAGNKYLDLNVDSDTARMVKDSLPHLKVSKQAYS